MNSNIVKDSKIPQDLAQDLDGARRDLGGAGRVGLAGEPERGRDGRAQQLLHKKVLDLF